MNSTTTEMKKQLDDIVTCEKCCSTTLPDNAPTGWVECVCDAHPGWYCENHSPGNECFDDEDGCPCCCPQENEIIHKQKNQVCKEIVEMRNTAPINEPVSPAVSENDFIYLFWENVYSNRFPIDYESGMPYIGKHLIYGAIWARAPSDGY